MYEIFNVWNVQGESLKCIKCTKCSFMVKWGTSTEKDVVHWIGSRPYSIAIRANSET